MVFTIFHCFLSRQCQQEKKQQQKEKTLNHSELRLASTQTCLTGILTQDVSVSIECDSSNPKRASQQALIPTTSNTRNR